MKYVDEYREGDAARRIAAEIRLEADPKRIYRFMEFCGGHTHVLARWGLTDILPPNVRMIHGPGCPVCVLPVARIDMAMQLALERNVILCTYADTMRVPAGKGTVDRNPWMTAVRTRRHPRIGVNSRSSPSRWDFPPRASGSSGRAQKLLPKLYSPVTRRVMPMISPKSTTRTTCRSNCLTKTKIFGPRRLFMPVGRCF